MHVSTLQLYNLNMRSKQIKSVHKLWWQAWGKCVPAAARSAAQSFSISRSPGPERRHLGEAS